MQIKTAKRYLFTPIRHAEVRKSDTVKCWQKVEERGTLIFIWENVERYSHSGKEPGITRSPYVYAHSVI